MGLLSTLERKQSVPDIYAGSRWWPTRYLPLLSASSGEDVSHENAVSSTAVWAAVTIPAGVIGTLPLKTMRKVGEGREEATSHSTYDMLHMKTNRWMTAGTFRELMQGWAMMRGNAFARKIKSNGGEIRELHPLHPSRVTVKVNEQGKLFEYDDPKKGPQEFGPDEVLHIMGFSSNGIVGEDPVHLMREAIGLALATEKHGARLFKAGGRGPGILHSENKIGVEKKREFSDEWDRKLSENPFGTPMLDHGTRWESMGFSAEEAQFLETRKFQIAEICRLFNIQPHILKDLERATFSNIEQQALEFEKQTIRPWIRRWEQMLSVSLLSDEERSEGYFFRFVVEDMLAADIKTRFEAYATAWQNGWMTTNEIRRFEDMEPIEDGDETILPLNVVPRSSADELLSAGNGSDPNTSRRSLMPALEAKQEARDRVVRERRLRQRMLLARQIRRAAERVLAAEIAAGRSAVSDAADRTGFLEWLEGHYEGHAESVTNRYSPILTSHAISLLDIVVEEIGGALTEVERDELERFAGEYAGTMGKRWRAHSAGRLEKVALGDEDFRAAVGEEYDLWEENRVSKIEGYESVRADGALARHSYAIMGVQRLRWMTVGENCPMCNELAGRVVGIRSPFLGAGDTLDVEGSNPLTPETHVLHPPLHGTSCDCFLMAG